MLSLSLYRGRKTPYVTVLRLFKSRTLLYGTALEPVIGGPARSTIFGGIKPWYSSIDLYTIVHFLYIYAERYRDVCPPVVWRCKNKAVQYITVQRSL